MKTPKNVDEVVPYARAAVRQIGGRSPLGLVEKGQSVLLVAADHLGEQLVLEAIKRAYAEEGIQACILYESEIVGISRDDALKIHGAKGLIPVTKEFGFGYFETEQSGDWSVNWFKKQQPDVAAKLFPVFAKDTADKAAKLQGLGKALARIIHGNTGIEVQPFRNEGKAVVP